MEEIRDCSDAPFQTLYGRHVVRARGHLGPACAAFTRAGQRPWSHATDGMVRVRLNGTGRVFIVNSCSVPMTARAEEVGLQQKCTLWNG
jgi:hypothetical protein